MTGSDHGSAAFRADARAASPTLAEGPAMHSEMEERLARAVQAELRRQGCLWEADKDQEDLSTLMMGTGERADLTAVVRVVIQAMREPTEAMIAEAQSDGSALAVYRDMIDAALNPLATTHPQSGKD